MARTCILIILVHPFGPEIVCVVSKRTSLASRERVLLLMQMLHVFVPIE